MCGEMMVMTRMAGKAAGAMTMLLTLYVQLLVVKVCGEPITHTQDICESKSFVGRCSRDEVVMVTSALYGRMRMGICVAVNMGYVGCSTDVLNLADERCSGKHQCEIKVPDDEFEKTKPCVELKSYLEVSRKCVKVATARPEVCASAKYVKLTSSSGYLASQVTQRTGCGTALCPWVLEVPKGQRINITLFDFGYDQHRPSIYRDVQMCHKYAQLRDFTGSKTGTVCGRDRRETHQYLSESNQLEVKLSPNGGSTESQFLIHYEAVGCADLTTPGNAQFQRNGYDEATVKCRHSSQSWKLKCKNAKWMGNVGNCSQYQSRKSGEFLVGNVSMPHGIAIAIVAGVAIVIGMLILTIGLVIFKRHMLYKEHEEEARLQRAVQRCGLDDYDVRTDYVAPSQDEGFGDYKIYGTPMPMVPGHIATLHKGRPRNEYTHIWEMPLPNPHEQSPQSDGDGGESIA